MQRVVSQPPLHRGGLGVRDYGICQSVQQAESAQCVGAERGSGGAMRRKPVSALGGAGDGV